MTTSDLHPTLAAYLPDWGTDWEPCEIVKIIPPSKSRIGRITGGHSPVYIIRLLTGDTSSFATPAYTVRSN